MLLPPAGKLNKNQTLEMKRFFSNGRRRSLFHGLRCGESRLGTPQKKPAADAAGWLASVPYGTAGATGAAGAASTAAGASTAASTGAATASAAASTAGTTASAVASTAASTGATAASTAGATAVAAGAAAGAVAVQGAWALAASAKPITNNATNPIIFFIRIPFVSAFH